MDKNSKIVKSLKPIVPKAIWKFLISIYYWLQNTRFRIWGRPKMAGETSKAKERRIRESFFKKYCRGKGLDLGYGGDLLCENCVGRDAEYGDAQNLEDIDDSRFDFVYSSHTLEHINNPEITIKEWWRILKSGGYLILYLPHRDLYEKRKKLPSRWNSCHKHFFLPDKDEMPDTIGIVPLIQRSLFDYEIVYVKECSEGNTIKDPDIHSDGEYSIEVVIQRK